MAHPMRLRDEKGFVRSDSPSALYQRTWKKANREKTRLHARRAWAKLRAEILEAYGSKCACCGESTPEFLSIDHVEGGGYEHRKRRGPNCVLRDVKLEGFPPKYQLLCHNCNMAKGLYGRCPHALEKEQAV
jgi:hypothetical protein